MALKNLLVRVGADITGLAKGMEKAQNKVRKFGDEIQRSIGNMQGSLAGAMAGIGAAGFAVLGADDAVKYEALMGTLSQSMGKSTQKFMEWQETVGGAVGYSKLQGAELANTLSLNFKKISNSQEDLVNKTTKMMETAAIVSAKRGMAMSEVSDRIRSAMNQEADGADELGVNVRVAAVEQSKAYEMMGASGPWDKLSENMRKTILYHHILEQVSTNLGDTMVNNTQVKLSVFMAALRDVRLALGQAFLPILNVVLPILTAFMRKIESALRYVSAFTQALFGKAIYKPIEGMQETAQAADNQAVSFGNVGEAVEEAGKKAASAGKEAKRGLAGFDEIHQIAESAASAGGGGDAGGGGGGGIDVPAENPLGAIEGTDGMFGGLNKEMDKLAGKIKDFFKTNAGWEDLKKGVKDFWQSLEDFGKSDVFEKLGKEIAEDLPDFFSDLALIGGGAFTSIAGTVNILNGFLNVDFAKAVEGAGQVIAGFYKIASGTIGLLFPELGNAMDEFGKKSGKVWDEFQERFVDGANDVDDVTENMSNAMFMHWTKFIAESFIKWERFKKDFIDGFVNLGIQVNKHWDLIMSAVSFYIKAHAEKAWEDFKKPFVDAYNWFDRNVVKPIINGFASIGSGFDWAISGGFKATYNAAADGINGIISDINKIKIPGVFEGASIPKIPRLAQGGITSRPTLAVVGDNPGGQEAITPLDRLQGFVTNAVMTAMNANNNNKDIVFNIDGRTFARIIKPHLDQETARIGVNLRTSTI
jgi:hypothetical protein